MRKVIIIFMICITSLSAHRLNVFTDYENDSLYINSYFPDGSACINCEIEIYSQDKLLKKSKTNKQGELTVNLKADKIKLVVDASMGHKVIKKLSFDKKTDKKKALSKTTAYDQKIVELEDENRKLRQKIKSLESQISFFNIGKIIFSILIIVGIFMFLKRVKS